MQAKLTQICPSGLVFQIVPFLVRKKFPLLKRFFSYYPLNFGVLLIEKEIIHMIHVLTHKDTHTQLAFSSIVFLCDHKPL